MFGGESATGFHIPEYVNVSPGFAGGFGPPHNPPRRFVVCGKRLELMAFEESTAQRRIARDKVYAHA
jgi:hypothetical protein